MATGVPVPPALNVGRHGLKNTPEEAKMAVYFFGYEMSACFECVFMPRFRCHRKTFFVRLSGLEPKRRYGIILRSLNKCNCLGHCFFRIVTTMLKTFEQFLCEFEIPKYYIRKSKYI